MDTLTDEELALHATLGEVYTRLTQICGRSATRADDLLEAKIHIHGLQDWICRNAAARAYPTKIRRLGAVIGDFIPLAAAGAPTTTSPPNRSGEPRQ